MLWTIFVILLILWLVGLTATLAEAQEHVRLLIQSLLPPPAKQVPPVRVCTAAETDKVLAKAPG